MLVFLGRTYQNKENEWLNCACVIFETKFTDFINFYQHNFKRKVVEKRLGRCSGRK